MRSCRTGGKETDAEKSCSGKITSRAKGQRRGRIVPQKSISNSNCPKEKSSLDRGEFEGKYHGGGHSQPQVRFRRKVNFPYLLIKKKPQRSVGGKNSRGRGVRLLKKAQPSKEGEDSQQGGNEFAFYFRRKRS